MTHFVLLFYIVLFILPHLSKSASIQSGKIIRLFYSENKKRESAFADSPIF